MKQCICHDNKHCIIVLLPNYQSDLLHVCKSNFLKLYINANVCHPCKNMNRKYYMPINLPHMRDFSTFGRNLLKTMREKEIVGLECFPFSRMFPIL